MGSGQATLVGTMVGRPVGRKRLCRSDDVNDIGLPLVIESVQRCNIAIVSTKCYFETTVPRFALVVVIAVGAGLFALEEPMDGVAEAESEDV